MRMRPLYRHRGGIFKRSLRYMPFTLPRQREWESLVRVCSGRANPHRRPEHTRLCGSRSALIKPYTIACDTPLVVVGDTGRGAGAVAVVFVVAIRRGGGLGEFQGQSYKENRGGKQESFHLAPPWKIRAPDRFR